MTTLEEAWSWYEETVQTLEVTRRLGDLYWNELPWEGMMGRDEHFKQVDGPELAESADRGLQQLNDLAIILFFSIFESIVRERIRGEVDLERRTLKHPVLQEVSVPSGAIHKW